MTSAKTVLLLQKWISMCWRALVFNFCCNAKSKVDVGFEELAALKHNLKVALRIYAALQNSRCLACRKIVTKEVRRSSRLSYYRYALCADCFHALTTVCTEHDDTLAENYCTALTEDGVHAAATLLNAYRAGSECRMTQANAAWVHNVIADGENFLPALLHDLPSSLTDWVSSSPFRASAGRKHCQHLDLVQRQKRIPAVDA